MSITMKMRHKVELNAPLMTVRIPGELQEGDADANAFVLELYRNHEPFEPDGETVTGYLTRADGNSVLLDGTVDKNIITVTLSQACYRVPGFFSAFIRLTNTEGEKRTIFKATGMMSEDKQGGIVDDEHVVPTLDDIIAQMEAVERATETATAAAETANAAAESAAEATAAIDKKVAEANAELTERVGKLSEETEKDIESIQRTIKETVGCNVIPLTDGYLSIAHGVIDLNTVKPSSLGFKHAKVACTAGDEFIVNGTSQSGVRAWAFCDGEGNVIEESDNVQSGILVIDNANLIAPDGAEYLVIHTTNNKVSIAGRNNIALLQNDTDNINEVVYYKKPDPFVHKGGYSDRDGVTWNAETVSRASNIALVRIGVFKRIILPDGYEMYTYQLDTNKKLIGNVYWTRVLSVTDLLADTKYVNFNIRYKANPTAEMTDAQIAEINEGIRIDSNYSDAIPKECATIEMALNYYEPDSVSMKTAIDESGNESANDSYKCTDFVKIPQKYAKNRLYTHAFDENGFENIALHFFDVNKSFIESVSAAEWVDNQDTYVYVRVVYPNTSVSCGLYFTNQPEKPTYTKPERYLLGTHDRFGYAANVISDGTMEAMVRTALRYAYDERWGYGTLHTAFAEECIKTTKDVNTSSSNYEGERYQMDCSTYVMSILMGLTPECSRYLSDKNTPADYGYAFNRLATYEGYVYNERQLGNNKRLYANSIAEYADLNGCLFYVEEGLKNIKPGDVMFISNQGTSYGFFENIGHCQIVYQTAALTDGAKIIQVFEAGGGTGAPCRLTTVSAKPENCMFAARFPLPYVRDTAKDIAQTKSLSTTVNSSAGDDVSVGTIELKEPLKIMRDYTVVLHGQFPDGVVPHISVEGIGNVGLNRTDLLVREDGAVVIRFALFGTYSMTNADTLTLMCKCANAVNAEMSIESIEVYDGFVTPSVHG